VKELDRLLAEMQYKALQIAEERDYFRTQAEEAENKLEKIMEKVDEVMEICPNLDEEHPYLGDVFDELRKIAGQKSTRR
jgi:hypothetical protein